MTDPVAASTHGSWIMRRARPDDADVVWPLAHAFATSFALERASFDRTFAALVAAPDTLLVVADRLSPSSLAPSVVGYLLATRHLTFLANGPVTWVEELMVDASARGLGVGRGLMSAAEAWSRDGGAAYLALATRRAGAFYAALGYDESAVFYKKALR